MNTFFRAIPTDFSGLVLLSNTLINPNSEQSVVVIVQHDRVNGTMGLCINHPLRLMLNDFDEKTWGNFSQVPVFKGGPVQPERIIMTSIEWDQQQRLKWQLGLNQKQANQLIVDNPNIRFKAYCGYIDWKPGQLLEDIKNSLWLPIPLPSKKIFAITNQLLWETLMFQFYPSKLNSKNFPKNPTLN